MASLLAQAGDILGELPLNEEVALFQLQQQALDQGHEWLAELADLEAMISALQILDGKSLYNKPDPAKRTGNLAPIYIWAELPEMKLLIEKAKENGWMVQERSMYFSFVRAGKPQFKVAALRETKSGGLSCRVIIPRIKTYIDLEAYLNSLDLKEFAQKTWVMDAQEVEKGYEILGRYFFFHEVHVFIEKITERLPNDKKTAELAGFQSSATRKASARTNKDSK